MITTRENFYGVGTATRLGIGNRARIRIKNGGIYRTGWSKWYNNVILNSGIDALFTTSGYNLSSSGNYLFWGTGTNPTSKRTDSIPVTLTQSGTTTVTSSGAFFASTDVGALLKFGAGTGGTEVYIVTYVSATQVTVSASGTQSAVPGVVWYVNQTGLQTLVGSANTIYQGGSKTYQLTDSPPQITYTNYLISSVFGSGYTITEIGFSSGSTSNKVFSRVLLAGGGVVVISGDQIECEYQRFLQFPGGTAPVSVGDVSGGTFNTAGTFMIETADTNTGNLGSGGFLDPGNGSNSQTAISATYTQNASIAQSAAPAISHTDNDSSIVLAYTNGNFYVDNQSTWNPTTANFTWYGISDASNNAHTDLKFTTPVSKSSLYKIVYTLRIHNNRVLSN